MAKTREGRSLSKPRNATSRRNSNSEESQASNNIENGLYVHSSPPKVVESGQGNSGSAHIREYLRGGNISGLEEVVLEGNGTKLLTQSSTDPKVRAFLKTLPAFMSKIDLVHDAAERGNLRDLKTLLDRRKIARSKDSQGMGLMHKAVLSGNTEMVEYLADNYPETAALTDAEGRTPLHYCAASKSPDATYSVISSTPGVDPQLRDSRGKTASQYMSRPADLKVVHKPKYNSGNRKKSTPSKRPQKVSTPPKREGLNITGANIRIWIHDQDLPKLERIVWEGQGQKLMKETSNIPKVRQFLNLVPRMMIKIKEVHQGAVTGDMEMLETKADQPELLAAKDQNGLNALHKAAALGHVEMCEWIIQKNQSALFTSDKMGRTPLHYSVIPSDNGETYNTLLRGGADRKHVDRFNKTAENYRNKPGELDLSVVYEPIAAPRSGNGTLDIPYSRGTSMAPSRSQSRAPSRARQSRSLNASRRNSATAAAVTPRRAKSTERPKKTKSTKPPPEDDPRDLKEVEFQDMSGLSAGELDKLILDGDVDSLEMVVLSGKGAELRGKTSWNADVRKFLKRVPAYMEKISSLHRAADDGNLKTVRQLTDRNKKMVLARAEDGSVLLHHIARSGNLAGVKMTHALYPDGLDVKDVDGKIPIHYAALSKSPSARETYEYLDKVGGQADVEDNNGITAQEYMDGAEPPKKPTSRKSSTNLPQTGSQRQSGTNIPRSKKKSKEPPKNNSQKNSLKTPIPLSNNASKNTSKNNSPANTRANSKNNSPAISRKPRTASNKSSAVNSRKATPANSKDNSRANSRKATPANSKNNSRANSRKVTPENSKNNSRANSMKASPANSKNNSRANSMKASPANSKNNSREQSPERPPVPPTPRKVSHAEADAEVEKDILKQIRRAESGDIDGLTDVILRGDGHLLVGRGSQDDDTQMFLDRVPSILEGIEDMHAAAEEGDTRKVKALLDRRKKASARDSNDANIMHKAVLNGHSDLTRYLAQAHPELLDQQDRAGRSPLHYAAVLRDGGHLYKVLNMAGADASVEDGDGLTAANYFENPDSITEKELKAELKEGIPLSGDEPPKQNKRARPSSADTERPDSGGTEDDGSSSYYGTVEEGTDKIDSRTLNLLEKAYTGLRAEKSQSLLKKHLTPQIFEKIKQRVTANGASLLDVIKSGIMNADSSVGVYAPDADSYEVFKDLFDPIINEYHEVQGPKIQHPQVNFGSANSLGNFDDLGQYVVSTRVRCARNLEGYPFNPLLTRDQYDRLEEDIVNALDLLDDDMAGYYRPLGSLTEEQSKQMINDHILFKQGDRFLEAANACRFWPHGRGIFLNSDTSLIIWVNEEDHLRIISMQKGGDLALVYDRFVRAVSTLGEKLPFSHSSKLGFLSFCPTNLGTGVRASVHVKLPNLMKSPKMLEETADKYNLQVRGSKGEHSEVEDGIFDVSNRRRLGLTEIDAMAEMYRGVSAIIMIERQIEEASRGKGRKRTR